jgi:phage repressor protein C with HTH and peptisase S24 domain
VPTLLPGDERLVDRDRRAIEPRGAIHVARIGGELVVKRLRKAVGGIEVVSDNPDYPAVIRKPAEVEVVGRVVWLSRAVV